MVRFLELHLGLAVIVSYSPVLNREVSSDSGCIVC